MEALETRSVEPQNAERWPDYLPEYLYELPEGALELPGEDDLVFGDDPEWSLSIPKALIEQLWPYVDGDTRMLPGRGLEVGGLLVGPKVDGGRVVVDRFIPLPIEYRYGPSFQLSVADLARIAQVMETIQLHPSQTIVGFYRSRTCGEEGLRSSDYEILDMIESAHPSYAADFRCYFILAPVSESDALAHIAKRDGGPWSQMLPFRLRSNPPSVDAPAVVETRRVGGWARILLYALTAIAGLASGYHWSMTRQAHSPSPVPVERPAAPAHLQFSVKRDGTVWKLSWNPASIEAFKPLGAILTIEDGGYQQQVPLTPGDLASGNLVYSPESSDLTFRLRIDRVGAHVEEHVRVLAAAPVVAQKPATKPVLKKAHAQTRSKARRARAPHKSQRPLAIPPPPQLQAASTMGGRF